MEDVREYLHLYLGCEVIVTTNQYGLQGPPNQFKGILRGYTLDQWKQQEFAPALQVYISDTTYYFYKIEQVKLILRRLGSMTEEEKIELHTYTYPNGIGKYRLKEDKINLIDYALDIEMKDSSSKSEKIMSFITIYQIALMNKWLLSKGFWLFGNEAFDKGLIIDSKTLNKEV